MRWCEESGWTDRGCAACAIECADRVDAAGAGDAARAACAPFSALGTRAAAPGAADAEQDAAA